MIKMFSNLRRICPKISFDVLNPTSSKASRSLKKQKTIIFDKTDYFQLWFLYKSNFSSTM